MTLTFVDEKGNPTKISEMLPIIMAGAKPVKTKLYFRNDYEDAIELSFDQPEDTRVKIAHYTDNLKSSEIGWVELEARAGLHTKAAIPLELSWQVLLTGEKG